MVPFIQLDNCLNTGWKLGRVPGSIKGHPSKNKGKVMINNSLENFMIDASDLDKYLQSGYNKGKVKK